MGLALPCSRQCLPESGVSAELDGELVSVVEVAWLEPEQRLRARMRVG